jgi:hypothetical protein
MSTTSETHRLSYTRSAIKFLRPILLLSAAAICGTAAGDDACGRGSSDIVCMKLYSPKASECDSGSQDGKQVFLTHEQFICKSGVHKGGGWDIWCRSDNAKCNLNPKEACTGLTQWHDYHHCILQGNDQPNWSGH